MSECLVLVGGAVAHRLVMHDTCGSLCACKGVITDYLWCLAVPIKVFAQFLEGWRHGVHLKESEIYDMNARRKCLRQS